MLIENCVRKKVGRKQKRCWLESRKEKSLIKYGREGGFFNKETCSFKVLTFSLLEWGAWVRRIGPRYESREARWKKEERILG